MTNKVLGRLGESYVCDLLSAKGYKILERNFQGRYFEIDLIALKGKTLCFIEVKTREEFELKEHYKAIDRFKILKIKSGVSKFLAMNPKFYDFNHKILAAIVLINPYTKDRKVVIYDCLD